MTFVLHHNGDSIQFQPVGEYVEITRTTTQTVAIREIETTNEWHGLWRYSGQIINQVVTASHWTSIKRENARTHYRDLVAQGWQSVDC